MKRLLWLLLLGMAHAQMVIVSSFNPNTTAFTKYVLPHVTTVMVRIDWSKIETSQGVYNFTAFDAAVNQWKGKQVAIVVSLWSDGGGSSATPAYVMQGLNASQKVSCPTYPAACPVADAPYFEARQKALMSAVVAHIAAKPPLYIRFGPENCPHCWQNKPWPGGEAAFMAYLQRITDYVRNIGTRVQVVDNFNGCIDNSWADQEAGIFAGDNQGIDMHSVSASDVTAYHAGKACRGNWCATFLRYPKVWHSLQGYDPDVITSPLAYIPFARTFPGKVNALELNEKYLDIAYNPSNPNYAQYGAKYRAVLQLP